MGFFTYSVGRKLSSGAAQYGFLGDATMSNKIPMLATGLQGRVNQRQIRTRGLSLVNPNPSLPAIVQPTVVNQSPGTAGLIDNSTVSSS